MDQAQPAACLALLLIQKRKKRQKKVTKRIWVKDWIQKRKDYGAVDNLLKELQECDKNSYKNFIRMSAEDFDEILYRIAPLISKKDTVMRSAITAKERLVVTLRYLATGNT